MPTFKEDAIDLEMRRQTKGLAIASLGSSIKRINKLRYRVKSHRDETKWNNVVKKYGHKLSVDLGHNKINDELLYDMCIMIYTLKMMIANPRWKPSDIDNTW